MLKEITSRIKELQKKVLDEGQGLLKDEFQEFFNRHPCVKSITWDQYAPYFNDGEPCEFSMHGWNLFVDVDQMQDMGIPEDILEKYSKIIDENDCYYESGFNFFIKNCKYESPETKLFKFSSELQSLLEDFDTLESACKDLEDLVMKSVFGDGVKIVATPEGFEIDDCGDHD